MPTYAVIHSVEDKDTIGIIAAYVVAESAGAAEADFAVTAAEIKREIRGVIAVEVIAVIELPHHLIACERCDGVCEPERLAVGAKYCAECADVTGDYS